MIKHLARAELKYHRAESRFLRVTILLAMVVMTYFFLSFLSFVTQTPETELPAESFLRIIYDCLCAIALIAFFLSFYMLFGAFRLCADRQQAMLGVLQSLGAGRRQRLGLFLFEGGQLAKFTLPSGVLIGAVLSLIPLPGVGIIRVEFLLLVPIIALFGFFMVELAAGASSFAGRGNSAIVLLRKNNNPDLLRRKSYRKSRTFNQFSVPVQLGRKNVDHYARRYRAIAVIFACAASVLLIGIVLYHYLGSVELVMDANPYDGIDTAQATVSAVWRIFVLTAVLSFLLSLMAVLYAINIVFGIMRERKQEFAVLQSIGMDMRQIRQMVVGECNAIGLMTIKWSFVFSLLISFVFSLIFNAEGVYYPFLPVLIGGGAVLFAVRVLGISACRYLQKINVIESVK